MSEDIPCEWRAGGCEHIATQVVVRRISQKIIFGAVNATVIKPMCNNCTRIHSTPMAGGYYEDFVSANPLCAGPNGWGCEKCGTARCMPNMASEDSYELSCEEVALSRILNA